MQRSDQPAIAMVDVDTAALRRTGESGASIETNTRGIDPASRLLKGKGWEPVAPTPALLTQFLWPIASYGGGGAGWQVPGPPFGTLLVLHTKFWQHSGGWSSRSRLSPPHGPPLTLQHFLSLFPAFVGWAQMKGEAHSPLLSHNCPDCFWPPLVCLHFLKQACFFFFGQSFFFAFCLHFFSHLPASTVCEPSSEVRPSPPRTASADLSRLRRGASVPTNRVSLSNVEPSTASFRSQQHTSAASVDVAQTV